MLDGLSDEMQVAEGINKLQEESITGNNPYTSA